VIPIVSILLRTAGEVYAALGVATGVGGCLFIFAQWLDLDTSPVYYFFTSCYLLL
jgi:hypothetical protein